MNACNEPASAEDMVRYLKGTLPELQARSFEDHYFECPSCLEQLEALEAVTLKLATEPPPRVRELRPKTPVLWPYYVGEAIAAVLVLGLVTLGTIHLMRRRPSNHAALKAPPSLQTVMTPHTSTTAMEALADTSLPPFQASHLRGADGNADFTAAMQAYVKHDCTTAVPLLQRVPRNDRDYAWARLYEGLCELHLKDWVTATDTLKSVAYRGDSPQQEAAFYYLAQAELSRDYASDAEQDLVRTVVLHGDFEHRATAQLDKLRSTATH